MNKKVLSLDQWNEIKLPKLGLTIGNFDGPHIGHVKLLEDFVLKCQQKDLLPVAFTFVPHPELYFRPDRDYLIASYESRRRRLFELGLKVIVECDFDKVRQLEGQAFANAYLLSKRELSLLWIGHDFTFGHNKIEPSSKLLPAIEVIKSPPVIKEGKTISSTLIREQIKKGNMKAVQKFLGGPFEVQGLVKHGKKLGRIFGFPTANICPEYKVIAPKFGVYSVEVLVDSEWREGIMNVGLNPSVEKETSIKWEAHILDYDGDLYNKQVRVRFKDFIREEIKFSNTQELIAQIKLDLETLQRRSGKV